VLMSSTWPTAQVPLLPLPDRVPAPVALLLAALLLAGLDLLGAVAAKNLARSGTFTWFAAGVLLFVLLFWVYASMLELAELSVVTLAWIVVLQVAVVILDRVRYQVPLGAGQVTAIIMILILQGYLVLSTSGPMRGGEPAQVTAVVAGSAP
jgi:hypothetical protein